jgi:murein DD-endopeptidase MepM/ murein hydrolase activator NlpD
MTGLSIALQADSPDQFTERMAVAGAALRSQNREVDRLVVVQAEMRAKTAKLTALRARTVELKRLAAQAVEARGAAAANAAAAETEQTRLVAEQATVLGVIKAKQGQEKARLAAATAAQEKLERILRDRAEKARKSRERRSNPGAGGSRRSGSSGGTVRNGGGYLSYPVNAPVTSGFGLRLHPILRVWRLHAGTDFGAACGTPVHAAADGVVVRAGSAGGSGLQIVLDHGSVRGTDLASSYNHLSRILIGGGRVSRGQVIGLVGSTGLSTGCHLHFSVYDNGIPVDPMRWL